MKAIRLSHLALAATLLTFCACATQRKVAEGTGTADSQSQQTEVQQSPEIQMLTFVQKVSDCKVYAKNVVADMTFSINTGSKDISLPGSVHMRKDEIIRLQIFIPILGSEVGRIDFTPDNVLIVDRMHRQYVRASYDQVSFLAANGLSFYSLQALFWNQLFLPGEQSVSESALKRYKADLQSGGQTVPVTFENGKMSFLWDADRTSGKITRTTVTYDSQSHGKSQLTWDYDDFRSMGVKLFPANQTFSFTTSATNKIKKVTVNLKMDTPKNDDNWQTTTSLSSKYKEIDAETLLKNIINVE